MGDGVSEVSQSGTGRMRGLVITKPIVFGNTSRYFGKKREDDGHTHSWCIYVRPYLDEDMSAYVKKVHFCLHASFQEPERIVFKPPYEIHETGWGEFDLTMKIFFIDPQEKPIVLNHLLKLFHNDSTIVMNKRDLVREFYDELVFVEPSPAFHRALTLRRPLPAHLSQSCKPEEDYEAKIKSTISQILELRQKTAHGIWALKEQLKIKGEAIQQARLALDELENDTLHG